MPMCNGHGDTMYLVCAQLFVLFSRDAFCLHICTYGVRLGLQTAGQDHKTTRPEEQRSKYLVRMGKLAPRPADLNIVYSVVLFSHL